MSGYSLSFFEILSSHIMSLLILLQTAIDGSGQPLRKLSFCPCQSTIGRPPAKLLLTFFLQNCPLKIFLAIDRHYCIYTPQSRIGWQNFCLKILRVSICVSSTTSASIFNKYSTLPNFSIVNLQMSLLAKLVIFYFPCPSYS